MNINLQAPVNKLGYGTVARNLLPELKKLGVNVSLFPLGNIEVDSAEEKEAVIWALKNAETFDYNAPSVKIWHQHDLATRVGNGPHYGWPIFELDTFTPLEKHHLNSVNVINCSKWAQSTCIVNGIDTCVGVVPLGYNPAVFYPAPMPIRVDPIFRVFNIGKWEIRKGHDILPRIFRAAFSPSDDVSLTMVCDNPFYTAKENDEWRDYYRKSLAGYKLQIVPRLETQYHVAELIRSHHCGFFPSRAEGWNLEALETLASNRMLVTTKYSGQTEFTGCEYNNMPPMELAIDGKWFKGQGNWLAIEGWVFDDLVAQLRAAYDSFRSGPNVDGQIKPNDFTWFNSAKLLCKVLGINYERR